MKKLLLLILLALSPLTVSAETWFPSGSPTYLQPAVSTWGLQIPSLINCTVTKTDANGKFSCGSGGAGAAGGTWSTTTSAVSGELINYSNNNTDIVNIGSTSTTTGKFYFDPNLPFAKVGSNAFFDNSSTSITNLLWTSATGTNATTTNLFSTTASTTNLFGSLINGYGLSTCTGTNALTWTGGKFTCTAQPQGTVTSVTGTANRITSTGGATPQIDISGSYVGQSSITTLGTITTGVWNGTAIANANLANSTISGVALGSNLFSHTHDSTLLGTSYNGSAAVSDWGIDLTHANTWTGLQQFQGQASTTQLSVYNIASFGATATSTFNSTGDLLFVGSTTLQNFTFRNATGTNATTTSLSLTTASTTHLYIDDAGLGTQCLHATNGKVTGTGSDCGSGSGGGNSKWATSTPDSAAIYNVGLGAVGIGTTTPRFQLESSTSTRPQLSLDNTSAGTDGQHFVQDWTGSQFRIGTSSDSTFTSTSTALTLDTQQPSGLAIATTTRTAVLTVGTYLTTGGSIGSTTPALYIGVAGSSTPSLAVDTPNHNGTVLIATTTNAVSQLGVLATGGKVYMSGLTSSGANQTDYLCLDGNNQLISDTTTCLASARKFKTNIEPLTAQYGLNALLQMKPVTFTYKDQHFGTGQQIGFVADDSVRAVPQLIVYDSNGDIHGFNYEQYTAVITKAVQELNTKVNWLGLLVGVLFIWNIGLTLKLKRHV